MSAGLPALDRDDLLAVLRGLLPEHLPPVPGAGTPDWGQGVAEALRRAENREAAARAAAGMFGLGEATAMRLAALDDLGAWADALLAEAGPRPARLTFRTSGSTGQPVAHTHEYALLWQEMAFQAGLYPGRQRVVGFVPCHHIYGFLFLVLLPKALAAPRLLLPPLPSAATARLLAPGDLAVAFPLFWAGLSQANASLAPDVRGVTSTGPCPAGVLHALASQGLECCTEIYGSSETAGIGYRHVPEGAYTLFDYWSPAGEGSLERRLPDGGIARYPLPDMARWVSPREFVLSGRRDRAVQVGGVNVYPERVRAALLQHPAVADCAVRLMRPEEGTRLKAFIVPREPGDAATLRRELLAWLEGRLSPAEMPKALSFGPELPATALGKAADWDARG